MKCKNCSKELKKGDYAGKELCWKCYQHDYITKKFATNPKYRQEQRKRVDKWQKENRERVLEMAKNAYYKRIGRPEKITNKYKKQK